MNTLLRLTAYELRDVARSRWLLVYGGFLLVVTYSFFRLSASGDSALLGLVGIVLFGVPLVTLVFATTYWYNARAFIEIVLAQPVRRRTLFAALYAGIAIPFAAVVTLAIALPVVLNGGAGLPFQQVASLLAIGIGLTLLFSAIGLLIVTLVEDRIRGLGAAVGVWLFAVVLYDGIALLALMLAPQNWSERLLLALTVGNPVDLARVAMLLQLDSAALLGYTGGVIQRFVTSAAGIAAVATALLVWMLAPLWAGQRLFARRDF